MKEKKRIAIDEPIVSFETPWDDGTNAYVGARIEEFLKSKISEALEQVENKFGHVKYEGGRIIFYDDDDSSNQLAFVDLTGSSYSISVESDRNSSFYVLTQDTSAIIEFTPRTTMVSIGSLEQEQFFENYTFRVLVDSGSGFVDRTPNNHSIPDGGTGSINIRPYIVTGANKVRIIVTGEDSGQIKTINFTVSLTTLTLSCNHNWQKAWIGGQRYSINNIFFGGNMVKTLHVIVDGVDYTQTFSAATQYSSVPYNFDLSTHFPQNGTGVYDVEIYMEGGGVLTESFKYRIMCVSAADVNTAKLICFNNVVNPVVNYKTQTLFEYSTYNLTNVTANINAMINNTNVNVVNNLQLTAQSQVRNVFDLNVQIPVETEQVTNLTITMALSGDGAEESITMPLDNSKAYNATTGANFYLNPANMSNNRSDRNKIPNSAVGYESQLEATWDVFTFGDDGWYKDDDNNKALIVKAGSLLSVRDLKPLSLSATSSLTIEMMYKVDNIADFDKPVLSFMSTAQYNEATTRGIMVFPTRIVVLTSDERAVVEQKLDLPESRIIHAAVVLQRNYANNGHNLCRIYINGRENCTFEYSGTSVFTDSSNYNYLRIGQDSTDFALYMMRTYQKALEPLQIHNNYINALIETASTTKQDERDDNDILDSGSINYDLCKSAGFNCMVIETDYRIPSLDNPDTNSLRVNMRFEYNDTPEWNVNIYNVPIDGQGTTSMKYYMWNLRNKISDSNTVWEYPNLRDGSGQILRETGKDGYIAGYGLHPKVSKITSKKNVASSPQGHKMGATAMYHDLFVECHGTNMLPNSNCRVAVYQNPFIGFQKFSDGHYEFIGLYTSGPDKTDKKTFGYNETSTYPKLMMVEGPNHAPYMTRFLVPWTDDVFYDYQNETLSTGDSVTKQEGWDADIAASYSTDKASDQQNIFNLFTSEFKPLYDTVYYTSPYIASLSESGKTLSEINANITQFQTQKTNGYPNELMTFYDSQYRLVYFRYKTQQYEVLPLETHNLKTYLGLSGSPTTQQIIQARHNKFLSTVFNYMDKEEALYMECFCQLFGVSDNYAKNTYWRKFKSIEQGGKWGFNQDDLDTLFQNDNNGQDTKEYFVESDDKNNGAEIYQGSTSAFFYHLRQVCENDIRDKMVTMVNKIDEMAGRLGCAASTLHQTVINVISHYFWDKSSKYFPAMAYNEDSIKAYISVWAKNTTASYNSVRPLTQLHGDHYETEYAWIERRIAYIFSKYRIGGFTGSSTDGYGSIEFTPLEAFDMKVKPAIDLYPRFSVGGAESGASTRTKAGDICTLRLSGSSDTTVYLKGVDWIQDIGDLSGLKLASRGGSNEINFTVDSKRLRSLILGSNGTVNFNATNISINGPAIETIDCHNAQDVRGILDLGNCPRLRTADFRGTKLTQIIPPVGSKLRKLQLPSTLNTLFLHTLNLLTESNLTVSDYSNIQNLYIENCSQLDVLKILKQSLSGSSKLKFVTIKWDEPIDVEDLTYIESLETIAKNVYSQQTGSGYGSLEYENGQLITSTSAPDIRGTINANTPIYSDTIDILATNLPNLIINYNASLMYLRFADPVVGSKMGSTYGDGQGMTGEMVQNVTSLGNLFYQDNNIRTFDELQYFMNMSQIVASTFSGCGNLRSVVLPRTITSIGNTAFQNCSSLTHINIPTGLTGIGNNAFQGCTSLRRVDITDLSNWYTISFNNNYSNPLANGADLYVNNGKLVNIDIPSTMTTIRDNVFYGCTSIEGVTILNGVATIGANSFGGCTNLRSLRIPSSVTSINSGAFNNCGAITVNVADPIAWCKINFGSHPLTTSGSKLVIDNEPSSFVLNGVTTIPAHTFKGLECEKVELPSGVTSIGANSFQACVLDKLICKSTSVPTLGQNAFADSSYPIYVPDAKLSNYRTASVWSTYASRIRSIAEFYVHPSATGVIDMSMYGTITMGEPVTIPYTLEGISEEAYNLRATIVGNADAATITSQDNQGFTINGSDEKDVTVRVSLLDINNNVVWSRDVTITVESANSEFFYIENLSNETNTISLTTENNAQFKYKKPGSGWGDVEFTNKAATIELGSREKVFLKGDNESKTIKESTPLVMISADKNFSIGGKIISLLSSALNDNSMKNYLCYQMFQGNTTLVDASELILPQNVTEYCYYAMFNGCTNLTGVPVFSDIPLAWGCYLNMFKGCTSLVNAPALPSMTLAQYCYQSMFRDCTSLVTAPELPATTLDRSCYTAMFQGCTSLVNAPTLPAMVIPTYGYSNMFQGCTSLVTAPELPATEISTGSYASMFYGCSSLIHAPEILPAMTLAERCYNEMFRECYALENAPILPALELVTGCYQYMFHYCRLINEVHAMFLELPSAGSPTSNWLNNVASTGTFYKNKNATWNVTGTHGVPNGWTVEIEPVLLDYFYIENLSNKECIIPMTTTYTINLDYSYDQKTWTNIVFADDSRGHGGIIEIGDAPPVSTGTAAISLAPHKKVYFRGTNKQVRVPIAGDTTFTSKIVDFNPDKDFAIGGIIMTLIYATTNSDGELVNYEMENTPFKSMFERKTNLMDASKLILPDNTTNECYYYMFNRCSSLVHAPELPATTLANNCYSDMFNGCTSLVNAPALPSMTLALNCYQSMFNGCTSLVTAPELPATTLATRCYYYMFRGCTSLVNAPELPATTLANYCYTSMFSDCTSLVNAPELPATTLADNCYSSMFNGCTSLNEIRAATLTALSNKYSSTWVYKVSPTGTFYKNKNATWDRTGVDGVPSGWNIVLYDPDAV